MLRNSALTRSVAGAAVRRTVAARRTLTSTPSLLNKSSSSKDTPSTPTSEPTPSPSPSTKPLVRESSSSPEQLNTLPLPYLSFALGVPTPPTSSSATWSETRERLVSPEHRMASRKAIVKEATRGYFHDFHAIKSHGGKTWRAPTTLIKADRAMFFPKFTGTRLSDKAKTNTVDMLRNKISIIALLGSKISEEHTKSFYADTLAQFATHPKFQLVQINLQSNPLKSYLVSLFLASLRSQVPEPLHPTYLLSSTNIELEKDALGLHNKHVGYTYLVDDAGRIRWAGGAFAEDAEKHALASCTAVLLDRFGQHAKPNNK
ncbi:related to ATP10-F1F0 ATPase complex assembly protein [Sporisorium reilianum SRZ2]|uniref:Related to ATP10-F1F0 ATPase complex assembly protein n=1 Tax=Sporisorium reilianum (strain SRZ2) TaxID=999809 RepID=E7A234_SPORE|nr:related to ATP10-F1F0 ATPase complex assembly protein [Sporisorium reilianum SRZ2]